MPRWFIITVTLAVVIIVAVYNATTNYQPKNIETMSDISLRHAMQGIDTTDPNATEIERRIIAEMDRRATAATTTIDLTVEEPFGGDEDGSPPPEDEIPAGMSPP